MKFGGENAVSICFSSTDFVAGGIREVKKCNP